MLLAVDVGNTQTVFGLFEGERLAEQLRVGTDRTHTGDELAVMLRAFVELSELNGIVLCSSVPQLAHEYEAFAERWAKVPLLVLGPGVPTGMAIRYDDPREVGADRIANAVAARERHGAPAVVVDFGTSTNFDVVSAAGEFAGGVLAPGIEVSMDALFARAARLPKVAYVEPPERVISQTTTAALQSGARLRLRRPGGRDRRRGPRGARRRRAGRRHGRPRGADRPAHADDLGRRPVAHPRRAAAGLGAEPLLFSVAPATRRRPRRSRVRRRR